MENFERKTSPKNGIDTENWFIESYRRYKGSSDTDSDSTVQRKLS